MENLYIMIKKWITVEVYMIFLNYFFITVALRA